jgi:hypothetical protein
MKFDDLDLKSLIPGDCVLVGGKGIISRGIKWFTDSKYSHAAIYIGGGKNYVIEATMAGVEKNPISDLLDHAESLCIRRIPELTAEDAAAMKDKAYQLLYESYDILQFISYIPYFIFRKFGINLPFLVFNKRNKMICSELYAVCALAAGVKFAKNVKFVTPEILYETKKMITIYEK